MESQVAVMTAVTPKPSCGLDAFFGIYRLYRWVISNKTNEPCRF